MNRTVALDNRSRTILKEIIRVHVDTGKPVSSRALFKSSRFDLSPASIRNIMADLTDAGFLAQPHTSAGRIPTDQAYRLYIATGGSPRTSASRSTPTSPRRDPT